MKVTTTKDAVLGMVKEALDNKGFGATDANKAANVSAVSDPSEAETNPSDGDFTPQDRTEFTAAVNNLTKTVPNDKMPALFKSLKDTAKKLPKGDTEDTMKTKQQKSAQQLNGIVEQAIRKLVREAIDDYEDEMSSADPADVEADAEEAEEKKERTGRRAKYKSSSTDFDPEGASFQEIANELGFSVAGAKQAVDKALEKLRFMALMDEDEREILVLNSMNSYIKDLQKNGLSDEDAAFMKEHPDFVRKLDGFRFFLDKVIRRVRKENQKVVDPLEDS